MTGALVCLCSDCGAVLTPNPRRKGTRCRRCNTRQMARDPEKRAKCRVAMKRRYRDPLYRQAHSARCATAQREAMKRPEIAELRREQGRRVGSLGLGAIALPAGAPARLEAGRKLSERIMAWCPIEYRPLYRHFRYTKLIRAPEAKRMILELIAADLAKYIATGALPQTSRMDGEARPC